MRGADILESFASNNAGGKDTSPQASEVVTRSSSNRQNPNTDKEPRESTVTVAFVEPNSESLSGRQNSENTFNTETVQEIQGAIELFRTGNLSKVEAIISIHNSLSDVTSITTGVRRDALERYGRTLNQIEENLGTVNKRGRKLQLQDNAGGADGSTKRHRRSKATNGSLSKSANNHGEVEKFIERIPNKISGKTGDQSRSDTTSSESESEEINKDVDEGTAKDIIIDSRSNKKQRVYESQLSWFNQECSKYKTKQRDSCNESLRLIDLYQRDLPAVK